MAKRRKTGRKITEVMEKIARKKRLRYLTFFAILVFL